MDKKDYDISVRYDDQPNEVADNFIDALRKYGIKVELVGDLDQPVLYYKIKTSVYGNYEDRGPLSHWTDSAG